MKVLRFLLGLAFGTAGVYILLERDNLEILFQIIYLYKTAVLVTGVIEIFWYHVAY